MESSSAAIQDPPSNNIDLGDPWIHRDLALVHWERFEQSGEREELEKSIAHDRTALKLCPEGHPECSDLLYNLATSLSTRYEQWGQWEDLEEAIALQRAALELLPDDRSDRSSFLNNLAISLSTRYRQCGSTGDLEEVIKLHRAALDLLPKGHPDRSLSLNNLASSLSTRYKQSGSAEGLEEAIELERAALELRLEGHPGRSSSLNNLAVSLITQYRLYGRNEYIEEAIEMHRAALELRPNGHPDRSSSLNNLASSLSTRYEQHGRSGDLEEAIELHQAALELCPSSHPDRSMTLNSFALTLNTRYKQHGRTEDLEKTIELERAALELRPEGHPERSLSLNTLALSLSTRYDHQGRNEDLEEAIELHRATLQLCPMGHSRRPMSLNNLALSLNTRYLQHGGVKDLDEAIELHRAALELHPEGHSHRSMSLNNLANSLRTQYMQHRRIEGLEKAIELSRAALVLLPEGHPNHSLSLNNLASSLSVRYEQNGRGEDLEEAIRLERAALKLRPEGHPDRSLSLRSLANYLYARIRNRWSMDEFEDCIQLLELAATHQFSGSLERLFAARRWAELARSHDHNTTFAAYKAIILILQHALTISPTLREQHDFLTGKNVHRALTLEAASYAIEKNKLEQAIEVLEQGRGLLWSQLRGLRTPLDQLAETNKELVNRLRNINRRLENLATSYDPLTSGSIADGTKSVAIDPQGEWKSFDELLVLKRQLSNEKEKVINEIRRVPGFESFLGAKSFEVLRQASSEGPVIVVNHCRYRSDVLIIHSSVDLSVDTIPLDSEFYEDSVELCNQLVGTRQRSGADSLEYDEKLRKAMKMLWDRVVSNVVNKLTEAGIAKGSRIWWCPTSVLTMLPFHAAGPFEDADGTRKYLLDDYVSSYTPTLAALINARSDSDEDDPTVLVIGDTLLRSAKQEISNVRNCGMRTKLLLGKKASHDSVIKAIQEARWVHFVCHGFLESKAFGSSFNLSDRGLTMLDIVQTNLPNAEFAFLSACHTAEQHHEGVYDEVLHLAAAMQFSGFRSVIGSMWELLDTDGPALTKVVYEYINDCEKGEVKYKRAAGGLRKAALELKARDGIRTERWVNLVHIGA
ncbi:uncharacterized protein FOMMEDRAFT_86160 [Fomitiporia mediterranea MF3/22]|uniref:uncharacterized protein n=1 Tax=Fomitiporia mediterranea (strain MF3/22) TaxID=694068 RepID=UPI00044091DB|nr:uncharacterized protein FOMMEDRAFT_86160 [Fomitiporia mediterranea MF3/22]EJD03200.1 hypothetical protein FOMMEDRAFT_86160 [Fomitiporia mediterranea MF3/22]